MNKEQAKLYLQGLDKNATSAVIDVDGETYGFTRKENGEFEGEKLAPDAVKKYVRETVKENQSQELEDEKRNSERLKNLTQNMINEKVAKGELKQKDVPSYLLKNQKQPGVYDSVSDGLKDLMQRRDRGDRQAKEQLNELWKMAHAGGKLETLLKDTNLKIKGEES